MSVDSLEVNLLTQIKITGGFLYQSTSRFSASFINYSLLCFRMLEGPVVQVNSNEIQKDAPDLFWD